MSQENVETLRRLYAEWAKGNVWALRDVADPNIRWKWSESLASVFGGRRVYHGLDEIGAATREWLEAWDWYWMTAEGFIEAGEEKVVVQMRLHARAAGSRSEIDAGTTAVWTLRGGRAVHVRYYDDAGEAFEAAGLSG